MAFLPAGVPDRSPNDRIPKNDNLSNGFSERTEYKLYVSNLPPELNEDGIRQIFNSYGEVTGVLSPRDAGWAYVTYRNHREAVLAIGKLDDKSPLHLKVEFSKERQTRNVQDWKRHNVPEASHPVETSIAPDFRDSGGLNQSNNMPHRKLEICLPEKLRSRHMVPAYSDQDEILYPVELDPRTLNPFENAVPYPETNILWTRGRLAVTDDGRRHVYMGRGYTYKIPDIYHPRMEENISTSHETRSNGLFEYGVDQLNNEVGRCELCGTITKMRCGKCSIFYCSRICQKTDWEKHKPECQALPPLTGISNAIPASMNGDDQLQRSNIRVKPELKERVNILNQRAKETQSLKQQLDEKERDTSLRTPNDISSHQGKINNDTNDIGRPVFPNGETPRQTKNDVPDISKLQISSSSPLSDNVESKEKSVSRNILQEQESPIEAPRQNKSPGLTQKSSADYKKVEESLAFQTNKSFLSKDMFTQVVVVLNLGKGEYWTQKVESEAAFAKMMRDLGEEQGSIPPEKAPKLKPVIGDLVACQFFNIWHRASIVSLDPLTVHYIDYGNDEVLTQNDIRPLGTFAEIPRYARKIRVLNAKGTKYEHLGENEKFSVKLISEDADGVLSVVTPDLEGDSPFQPFKSSSQNGSSSSPKGPSPPDRTEPPTSPRDSSKGQQGPKSNEAIKKDSPTPTGSVIDNLEIKDLGVMEIHTLLRKNAYSVTIVPNKFYEYYKKVLMELPAKCITKAKTTDNYQPKEVDELVLCKRADDDWLRGKVLSVGPPVKVATLDDARVCLAELCFRMPPSVAELCTFGGTCTLIENDFKVEPTGTVLFQVLSSMTIEGQKRLEVLITAADEKTILGKAFLSAWKPPPEQVGVQALELKSDTEVILTAFRSPSLLYVRSLEDVEVERFNRLLQQVAKKAQTAGKLKNPPVVGEMVIAKFKEDGNHYRAIVRKIDGDNYHIAYVDFGNVEVSSMKEMLELPEELKACPAGVAKIILKGVPTDVPLNPELSKYFGLLAGREQPLKISFEGIPSKDGVELKTTNESVNEKVQQLLTPNWKKTCTAEEKTCFVMRDLETATLGKVGEIVNALVLHTEEVGTTYFMCPMDIEMVGHVSDILPGQIAEYVANAADNYIPRDLELCIAPFEGSWYRGACLMRNATPTSSSIFFVDYGNISQVEHKDLRLMPKDFMTPPALACICNVQYLLPKKFEKEIPKKVAERLEDLLAPNSMIKIKIIMEDAEKNYTIELPEIRDILLKENLI